MPPPPLSSAFSPSKPSVGPQPTSLSNSSEAQNVLSHAGPSSAPPLASHEAFKCGLPVTYGTILPRIRKLEVDPWVVVMEELVEERE